MLQTCPKCKSQEVSDKTAERYYALAIVFAVIGTVLVFFAWGWGFLAIAIMLILVMMAVEQHNRKYRCKDCDNEWEDVYYPSGEKPIDADEA